MAEIIKTKVLNKILKGIKRTRNYYDDGTKEIVETELTQEEIINILNSLSGAEQLKSICRNKYNLTTDQVPN